MLCSTIAVQSSRVACGHMTDTSSWFAFLSFCNWWLIFEVLFERVFEIRSTSPVTGRRLPNSNLLGCWVHVNMDDLNVVTFRLTVSTDVGIWV
jgi:hypothetical protein